MKVASVQKSIFGFAQHSSCPFARPKEPFPVKSINENKMSDKFEDFQIEEYKNISNAHFETNKQIGVFFRYFLLIASAPALVFLWFGKDINLLNSLIKGNEEVSLRNIFVGFFLLLISIIGLMSSFYLISLRLDSILYARTVNGIRKFFYNKKNLKNEDQQRVLPKQTNIPKYFDIHTFGILILTVAIINSIYFALGSRVIAGVGNFFFPAFLDERFIYYNYSLGETTIAFILFLLLHLAYYSIVSKYRRVSYMKSRIIGIDIDGVLNKHRTRFCEIHFDNLKKKFGDDVPVNKKLKPEEINIIPVSNIEGKDIDKNDEFDIFNNPEYWQKQVPIDENIGKIIKQLKNGYGYKINIHSYRPWPDYLYGKLITRGNEFWRNTSLEKITKVWLKDYQIPFNKLFIEKHKFDSSKRSYTILGLLFGISEVNFKNRFYHTEKSPYRYFIEDDIDNAIKLSSTCEYVFLMDQPYNRFISKNDLPINIVRVKDWLEIYARIKQLG